jgi:hypothetical protein
MNSKKFLLGLVSSLLLAVGFTKAAEFADPLRASQNQSQVLSGGQAPDCYICAFIESDR